MPCLDRVWFADYFLLLLLRPLLLLACPACLPCPALQADILMVTDGEIPAPSEAILQRLAAARESLGLEVHGLLVGSTVTPPMQALCTHLHIFKSWSTVS